MTGSWMDAVAWVNLLAGLTIDGDFEENNSKPHSTNIEEWHHSMLLELIGHFQETQKSLSAQKKSLDEEVACVVAKENAKKKKKKQQEIPAVLTESEKAWNECSYKWKPIDVNDMFRNDLALVPSALPPYFHKQEYPMKSAIPPHFRPIKCETSLKTILVSAMIPNPHAKKMDICFDDGDSHSHSEEACAKFRSMNSDERLELELASLGILPQHDKTGFDQVHVMHYLDEMTRQSSDSIREANRARILLQGQLMAHLSDIKKHNQVSKMFADVDFETGSTLFGFD